MRYTPLSQFLKTQLPRIRRADLVTVPAEGSLKLVRDLAGITWHWRKQALLTAYLLLMGFALGVIYIYATGRGHEPTTTAQAIIPVQEQQVVTVEKVLPIPFEEGHQQTEVVVSLPDLEVAPSFPRTETRLPESPPLWKANAVAVGGLIPGQPQISIVIDDLGILKDNTRRLINMQPGLTLSFLPYATDLEPQTDLARRKGHELMLHLPMQPRGDALPGPHALKADLGQEELLGQILWNLDRFDGYVGINNHMGSAFTEDYDGISQLLSVVRERGLLVLDSKTTNNSVLAGLAEQKDIPHAVRDVFLDNTQDVDYILGQLDKLEEYARRHGSAVAIGHPYDETIAALELWLPKLREKGITLVPLSHIVEGKYRKTMIAQGGMDQAE
ncbi:divergent polysaccharide deacetylase family protein [Emcibacter sp.]|uniref:divergent polysaccharide deacetylase family protein n=1 Tax=Emcibacter sp. TaxID=1979954 RepID=UPI002AA8FFCD|nr:divergent polysaccharide deacetylase family protein [Emcibacter sp.]